MISLSLAQGTGFFIYGLYTYMPAIIYDIYDERVTVLIIQAEEHYNDKYFSPLLLSQQFLADFADTFKNFSEGIGIFMLLHHIYVGMNEKVVEIFGCFVIICLSLQLIWQNSIVCTITINA